MKKAGKRVIPGFGVSMGVTLSMVSLIVIIPLASLVIFTAQMSLSDSGYLQRSLFPTLNGHSFTE